MIPDLRQGILYSDVVSQDGQTKEESVVYQLQLIFANLIESEKQYFSPMCFIDSFKFYGEKIQVRVQ